MPAPAIEVRDLTKRFGPVLAVDRLSFAVEEGTVTGFLGPNGAGKTTTLRALLGLVRPTAGTALVEGKTYRDLDEPFLAVVGAVVDDHSVTFRFADAERRLVGVRLFRDRGILEGPGDFTRDGDGWVLRIPRPPLRRLEYEYQLFFPDGSSVLERDPDNPSRVAGVFGEKSVLELPGYVRPAWLDQPAPEGRHTRFRVPSADLGAQVAVELWSPAGTRPADRLPLVVVNDGREYDVLASLSRFSAAMIAADRRPPHRLVLLHPTWRDQWYSASPAYARAMATEILAAVRSLAATAGRPIGMGTSLGALAMLHAHRRYPRVFGGLFLQSGSFFTTEHDSHEGRFPRWRRIVRFVDGVHRATSFGPPVPVVMTCGAVEENVRNNRLMAEALARQGYSVELHEVGDTHNYVAWRDTFDPYLTDLLGTVGSEPGAAS
ncbi:MAG: ATP-binding cassette domain-containing protein [Acidimicrobiales bacterium]